MTTPLPLTEEQIERRAEIRMDRLDALLMNETMTQDDYDEATELLDQWCEQQYALLRKETV